MTDTPKTPGKAAAPPADDPGRKYPAGRHPRKRGAKPTPRNRLLTAHPFRAPGVPPAQVAYVPKQLSFWLNDSVGDCVTAEEAFAKAAHQPEIFIPDAEVKRWASAHDVLDGAIIEDVLKWMTQKGFGAGNQLYNDGSYSGVDWTNEGLLRSAIAQGPVKIGIDANALPQSAGPPSGWVATGGSPGQFSNTDHCVALTGYGPAGWLYEQLGIDKPESLKEDQQGFLLFTWDSIGFVDFAWIMSTCAEAWVRNPTTVGIPPLSPEPPPPGPGPGPGPAPGPGPGPAPNTLLCGLLSLLAARLAGNPFLLGLVTALQVQHGCLGAEDMRRLREER